MPARAPPPRPRPRSRGFYLFTPRFWAATLSTKWPYITSFAAPLAVMTALLCLAQFGLGIYIAIEFMKVGTVFECWDGGNKVEKTGKVTIIGLGGESDKTGDGWKWAHTLDGGRPVTTVYFSVLMPLLIFLPISILIYEHFSRSGLSIRHALYWTYFTWIIWATNFVEDLANPDASTLDLNVDICQTPLAEQMWKAKQHRSTIWEVRDYFVALIVICQLAYVMLAFNAAYLNDMAGRFHDARVRDLELQPLPPSQPTPAATAPPSDSNPRRRQNATTEPLPNPEYFEQAALSGNPPYTVNGHVNGIKNVKEAEKDAITAPLPVSPIVTGDRTNGSDGRRERVFKEQGLSNGVQHRRSDGSQEPAVLYENPFADPPEVTNKSSVELWGSGNAKGEERK